VLAYLQLARMKGGRFKDIEYGFEMASCGVSFT
jgi:hypothetical protein